MPNIIEFKQRTITTEKPKESKLDTEVETITDAVLSSALDSLIRAGYNLEDNFNTILPSIILIKESITALQLKLKNEEHHLHEYAESTFIIVDDE